MWSFIIKTALVFVAVGASIYFSNRSLEENNYNENPRARRNNRKSEKEKNKKLRNEIISRLNLGTYDCSICLDLVSGSQLIWFCRNCYVIYHLKCVQNYYRIATGASCPLCRTALNNLHYSCFCGRNLRIVAIPGRTPHSCGRKCINTSCSLPCHPGPCD